MRLLVIGLDRDVARAESRSAKRQLEYYRDYDVDILIVAPGEASQVALSPRVTAHVSGGVDRARAWINVIRSARRLLREKGHEVLTVQDPFFCGWAGALARWGLPTRLHIQDHSGAFARQPLGLKEKVMFTVSRILARGADRVRTVSRRGADGLKRFGLHADHIDVVPVASDVSRHAAVEPKMSSGANILCVSRLGYEKGVDVLISAMPQVRAAVPEARLTIVGSGAEKNILESLVRKIGAGDYVIFAGAQPDTTPFLGAADVYVQPSRFEGWGIAVIEAAAAGKVIVMTDVGCAGEVIFDGESGLVVPPQDVDALAQAMIRLLKDPVLAKRLGDAAKQSAARLPDAPTIMQRLRESLERTAGMGRRDVDNGLPMFAAALIARFAVLALIVGFAGVDGLKWPDSSQYLPLADSLLAGKGFTIAGGAFSYRTIGYPLLLAVGTWLTHSLVAVAALQAIFSSFAVPLVMAIGRRLGLDPKTRRAAGWLTALEPHLVYYALPILVEGVFIIPFLALVYMCIRFIQERRLVWAVWAGLLLGITLLIKPLMQAYPLFIVLLLALAVGKRSPQLKSWVKGSVVFILLGLLVTAPWAYRNYRELGTWQLSSQGGNNLAQYLAPSIISVRDQISYQAAEAKVSAELEARYGKHTLEGRDLSGSYATYGLEVVRANPVIFLKIAVTSAVSYWTSHDYATIPHKYHLTPPIDKSVLPPTHYLVQGRFGDFAKGFWTIFGQPFYALGALGRLIWAIIAVFMCVGLWEALRKGPERPAHLFMLSLFVYFTAITVVNGLGIDGRLRYHFMPLILLYAVYGWNALAARRKKI